MLREPTVGTTEAGAARKPLVWTAQMVRPLADRGAGGPGAYLRGSFHLEGVRGGETLFVSALGLELAAAVFLQEEAPGWLYQLKHGATTIWERWDAIRPDGSAFASGMNSYNHYAYGAVCQWLFESVAGFRLDPENPGFRHIVFEPLIVPALGRVGASHESRAGRIEAGWGLEGERATYSVTVPEGAYATLLLRPQYQDIQVNGRSLDRAAGKVATSSPLGPGRHDITFWISSNHKREELQ